MYTYVYIYVYIYDGGGRLGWRNALNNALCCLEIGPRYHKLDMTTKSTRWAYFTEVQKSEFRQRWELHKEWRREKHAKSLQNSNGLNAVLIHEMG